MHKPFWEATSFLLPLTPSYRYALSTLQYVLSFYTHWTAPLDCSFLIICNSVSCIICREIFFFFFVSMYVWNLVV